MGSPRPTRRNEDTVTEDDFRTDAAAKGYETPVEKDWAAHRFNDWHTHPFCLYVYILAGQMTLELETPGGRPSVTTIGPGGAIEVPVDVRHTERMGPAGARFYSAPRPPKG